MIKFFATNRAIEYLGRSINQGKSSTRHKLSEGGYYFIDMEEYMRFYLGTTDAAEIPKEAVVENSRQSVFEQFLSDERISAIVVCAHGFNVELFEAFTWFRILTDSIKHLPQIGDRIVTSPSDLKNLQDSGSGLTAFIGFSWPSNGNVLSYLSDQNEANGSKAAFGSLLTRLRMTGKSVNLICHSMGNYLACHTFAALVDKQIVPQVAIQNPDVLKYFDRGIKTGNSEHVTRPDGWLIDNYVMIAPDVERRHVTKCAGSAVETDYVGQFYSGLQHMVNRKINFYSRFDGALTVSNVEKLPREIAT